MWILQAKRGLAVYDVWPRHVWIMDRGCRTQSLSKNENKRVEVIGVETAYKVEEALII